MESFLNDDDDFPVIQRFFANQYLNNPILFRARDGMLAKWLELAYAGTKYKQEEVFRTMKKADSFFFREVGRSQKEAGPLHGVNPEEYEEFLENLPQEEMTHETQARKATKEHMSHVMSALATKAPISALGSATEAPLTREGQKWCEKWSALDSFMGIVSARVATGSVRTVCTSYGPYRAVGTTEYVVFLHMYNGSDVLLTWDQCLMFKDMCYSRFQVHAACVWFYPDDSSSLLPLIERQWKWQMTCLTRHGNEGYELAKCTEELSKAYMSYMTDDLFGKEGSFPRFVEKIRAKEKGIGTTEHFLVDMYVEILHDCSKVLYVVELFGLQKMCGHPLVDAVRGGLSAASEARAKDKTTFSDALRLRNNFCRIYLQAYVGKHGKWPPLRFETGEDDAFDDKGQPHEREPSSSKAEKKKKRKTLPLTTLHRLHNMQYRHLTLHSYPLEDWNTCHFKQHQEFDYHDNFLDLMDDKSISYYRGEKHATWDYGVRLTSNKRLLLEMISREEISARDIVARVMRRDIPIDWFIVSLYPKEREFKLAPRMFSMLVFEIRFYFACTEANLADSIFPYLPQQTMTKDKVSVLRKFGDITAPLSGEGRVRWFCEADLSRWNLRWRSLVVHLVGDVVDAIFGLRGVYTFVHEFFAECLIVVRTPEVRPPLVEIMTPPESDTLWYNHVGGFEGITQKLWSVCTYSMVDLSMHAFPVSYILMGQADNQILAITAELLPGMTKAETAQHYSPLITESLDKECKKVNQNLKPEECLESGSVLTYSKDVYINGVDYHTTLKAHSRLFPNSSSDFPSVAADVGAIFSSGTAGAERSRMPLISYALSYYHSYMYLLRVSGGGGIYGEDMKKMFPQTEEALHKFIQYMLWLPSEMGGLSTQGPANFLYKGGSDPLARAIASVHILGMRFRYTYPYSSVLREAQEGAFLNPTPRMAALVKDPYGLPIHKPSTPADRVARATLEALRPDVKNVDLEQIMSTDCSDFGEELIEHLIRMTPFNPLVAHDLYDCSVAGIVESLSKLLTSTRTIQTFVRERESSIVENLLSQERSTWRYFLLRWKTTSEIAPVLALSIFDTCVRLRSAWKRNGGKEPVGVTTYHPFDFEIVWGPQALVTTGISFLLHSDVDPVWHRGKHDPYLGSMTREKRSEHGYRIIENDTASADFRKLQLIASQVKGDAEIIRLIDVVGLTRSTTLLSPISTLLTHVSGGTVGHRYASRLGHLGAYSLGCFCLGSNAVISSDNAGILSGGKEDYPVMLQEYFLTLLGFSHMLCWMAPGPISLVGTIRIGHSPLVLSDIRPASMEGPTTLVPFCLPGNKLAFKETILLEHNRSLFAASAIASAAFKGILKKTPSVAREVAIAWVRSILRKNSAARAIADTSSGGGVRLIASLDLAETIALGYERLIFAMGIAVAEEGIYNLWRSAHHREVRWKLRPFIWKLAEALSSIVCEHMGHPLLSHDPYARRHSLFSAPEYSGGNSHTRLRIVGLIATTAEHQIRQRSSHLYVQRMAVFASDSELGSSEVTYKMLCLLLHRAWIAGSLKKKTVSWLMTKYLMPLGSNKTTEEGRMSEARALAYGIAGWATDQRLYDMAEDLLSLGRGHRLVLYPIAVEEALRDMRKGHEWGLALDAVVKLRMKPLTPRPRSHELSFSSSRSGMEGWRVLGSRTSHPQAVVEAQIATSKGRVYGTHSSAHYSFPSLIAEIRRRDVLVVGSGHGAVARLCLETGAQSVFGLDLRDTLPLEGHNFRWYKPPMVAESDLSDRYVQMPESFITSGDWMNKSVSQSVLSFLLKTTVIVIDIQLQQERPALEVLNPLLEAGGWPSLVVVRLYLTLDECEMICSDLQAGGARFHLYPGAPSRDFGDTQSFVIHFDRLPDRAFTSSLRTVRVSLSDFVLVDMSYMGGGEQFLKGSLVFSMVPVGVADSIRVIRERLEDVLLASHGDYLSRPSYGSWTLLLHGLVGCDYVIGSDSHRTRVVRRLLHHDDIHVRVRSRRYTVQASSRLLRHLSKVASRLL